MLDAHPSRCGMPSSYNAEISGCLGRWTMSVNGPDRAVVAGPRTGLGPSDVPTVAHPDDPGRHLIAISGNVPVLAREQAAQHLDRQRARGRSWRANRRTY